MNYTVIDKTELRGEPFEIEVIYVATRINELPNGECEEGIVGTPLPLVASHPKTVKAMKALAKAGSEASGKNIKIYKFTERKLVKEIRS